MQKYYRKGIWWPIIKGVQIFPIPDWLQQGFNRLSEDRVKIYINKCYWTSICLSNLLFPKHIRLGKLLNLNSNNPVWEAGGSHLSYWRSDTCIPIALQVPFHRDSRDRGWYPGLSYICIVNHSGYTVRVGYCCKVNSNYGIITKKSIGFAWTTNILINS